jgi:hypothetical protein
MADTQKILDALAQLDHDNDDHWLPDGHPKLGVVQKLAKDQTIKHRDIEEAEPGFIRVNPLRVDMIANTIAQNPGEALTVENLARFFPENFELSKYDLKLHREPPAEQPIEFEGAPEPQPQPMNHPLPVAGNEAEQTPEPPPPPAREQIENAAQRRIKADQDLANARILQMTEDRTEHELRAKLAKAVTNFQAAFPPITRDTLMRQYNQEQAAIRGAIARGEMPAPQSNVPRGAVSRAAYFQKFGHGARTGGGRAYASRAVKTVDGKGPMQTAYPAQAYGRKVPSEV